MAEKITIKAKSVKRVILVGDQMLFILKDGTVQHCNGTNSLVEMVAAKNTPIIASLKID